jgi:hypothetical protein
VKTNDKQSRSFELRQAAVAPFTSSASLLDRGYRQKHLFSTFRTLFFCMMILCFTIPIADRNSFALNLMDCCLTVTYCLFAHERNRIGFPKWTPEGKTTLFFCFFSTPVDALLYTALLSPSQQIYSDISNNLLDFILNPMRGFMNVFRALEKVLETVMTNDFMMSYQQI